MRQTPYPAGEDELLKEHFAPAFLEDRKVICAGAVSENLADWTALVVESRDGTLHLVERIDGPDRTAKTVSAEADQAHWMAAFERLMAANDKGVPFDVNSWLRAGGLVARRGPWDRQAESAMWHRVVDVGAPISFSGDPEAEVVKMTVRIAAVKGDLVQVVQELNELRDRRIAEAIDHLKRTGTAAARDDDLVEAFHLTAPLTVAWSLTDRGGEKPYRACVLMGDKGFLHLAETFGEGIGRIAKLGPLGSDDWRRLVGLARLRMLETREAEYGEAYERAEWVTALMPPGSAPNAAMLAAIEEAAEMRSSGFAPS